MASRNQIEGGKSSTRMVRPAGNPGRAVAPAPSRKPVTSNGPGGLGRAAGLNQTQINAIGGAPAPRSSYSGGGGGGGGGGGYGGGGGMAPMSAPVPQVSEEDYFASDQILTAALGALDRALKDYESQYTTDVGNYERDYGEGLRNLGWRDQDPGEAVNMGWDWNDVLASSGRAYQNQTNDFANRGMLQSQGYLDAQRLLERSLNDQRGAMETSRTDFMGDMGRRKAEFTNQDTLARQQARAESAARRAAEYGIV